ncbi:hypothetical protein PRIPAC_71311, partial [Pristionchus pacificus]|uniref:Uncharacterized protein n=1 Tax=Pristionchus pacificus TaxID=54126 RepID=A0A2A6C1H6_PRIPA
TLRVDVPKIKDHRPKTTHSRWISFASRVLLHLEMSHLNMRAYTAFARPATAQKSSWFTPKLWQALAASKKVMVTVDIIDWAPTKMARSNPQHLDLPLLFAKRTNFSPSSPSCSACSSLGRCLNFISPMCMIPAVLWER